MKVLEDFILFFVLLSHFDKLNAILRLTNVQCNVFDKTFVKTEVCKLKKFDGLKSSVTFQYRMLQQVNDGKAIMQLQRYKNGWHPFHLNIKMDFCDFFKNPKKYMLFYVLYDLMKNYTSLNHTCPYKVGEAINLVAFELEETQFIGKFPLINGEYGVFTKYFFNGELRASVNVMASYSNN